MKKYTLTIRFLNKPFFLGIAFIISLSSTPPDASAKFFDVMFNNAEVTILLGKRGVKGTDVTPQLLQTTRGEVRALAERLQRKVDDLDGYTARVQFQNSKRPDEALMREIATAKVKHKIPKPVFESLRADFDRTILRHTAEGVIPSRGRHIPTRQQAKLVTELRKQFEVYRAAWADEAAFPRSGQSGITEALNKLELLREEALVAGVTDKMLRSGVGSPSKAAEISVVKPLLELNDIVKRNQRALEKETYRFFYGKP